DGIRDKLVTGVQTCALPILEPSQVYPFLPTGSGSVVLVTSNDTLSELVVSLGAEPLAVDELNADHGKELLANICGRARLDGEPEIGRASCRERVEIWGAGVI